MLGSSACHRGCRRAPLQPKRITGVVLMAGSSRDTWNWGTPVGPPPAEPARQRGGHRDWMQQQAVRMDFLAAATKRIRLQEATTAPKSGMPSAPVPLDHRASHEGIRAVGFNPSRHVWYIMGRPVCVLCRSKSILELLRTCSACTSHMCEPSAAQSHVLL